MYIYFNLRFCFCTIKTVRQCLAHFITASDYVSHISQDVNCIKVAQGCVSWQALVLTASNFHVLLPGNLLTRRCKFILQAGTNLTL
jgi:hypothetical protein